MKISNPRVRAGLVFVLAALILWFRAPIRVQHGFLWAEDAPVFLYQAYTLGIKSIFAPYAGYVHLVPRLIAWIQYIAFPVRAAPYFYMWSALIVAAGACAYIAAAVRTLPASASIALGLSIVLSPQNGEMLLTITNLQWLLCPMLIILLWECLFSPPESGVAWRSALTAALAMTGPFGFLLCPVALIAMALATRSRSMTKGQIFWFVCFATGVAVQAMTLIANPQPHGSPGAVNWASRILHDLFCALLPGAATGAHVPAAAGVAIAILFVVACAGSRSLPATFLLLFGILLWAASVLRIGNPAILFTWFGAGSRYVYLPLLFFAWIGIICASQAPVVFARWLGLSLVAMTALASATQFEAYSWPDWAMERVPGSWKITVPPGWTVNIPIESERVRIKAN